MIAVKVILVVLTLWFVVMILMGIQDDFDEEDK